MTSAWRRFWLLPNARLSTRMRCSLWAPISLLQRKTTKMKTKTVFLALAFCLCAVAASFAANPNVGTWKLNEAKSKIPAGTGKNTTVTYTADGDNLKAVLEGVDGKGNPTQSEWVGKFDGKDYPSTGDSRIDSRSITKVDDRHYKIANKKTVRWLPRVRLCFRRTANRALSPPAARMRKVRRCRPCLSTTSSK